MSDDFSDCLKIKNAARQGFLQIFKKTFYFVFENKIFASFVAIFLRFLNTLLPLDSSSV